MTRPAPTAVVVTAALLGAAPVVAGAQRGIATIDAGAAALRLDDTVRSAGASVTPAVLFAWQRATLGASLTLSQLADGWSSQAVAGGSAFSPAVGPIVMEVAATGGGSRHPGGFGTYQLQGIVRAHVMGAQAGVWGGAGAGSADDGLLTRGVRVAEVGAWRNDGPLSLVATLSPTAVDDSIRFADVQAGARWRLARAEIGATTGVRAGDVGTLAGTGGRAWGSASATLWVTNAVAIVGSAGSYPMDLTQGFPGGRFASVGVRLATAGARPVTVAHGSRSTAADRAERAGLLTFRSERQRGGMQRFEVRAPRARRVEIIGDFTDWAPVALRRGDDGVWTTTVAVPRGTHQLNMRVDGGAWLVPPALPSMRDEFGGAVGLLTVE